MSYFRAVIDFVVLDEDAEEFAEKLRENLGDFINDEPLAHELVRNIQAGVVEIDGISMVEDFG